MSATQFNQLRTMPFGELINQPKKELLAFAKHYFKANNTELHIIKTGE